MMCETRLRDSSSEMRSVEVEAEEEERCRWEGSRCRRGGEGKERMVRDVDAINRGIDGRIVSR